LHDAISAEKLGIPAVGVMTDRFLPTARAMANFLGLHEYPVACITHPISNNTAEQIRTKAAEIVAQSVSLLLLPPDCEPLR
jgi:hypothetical protein